MSSPLANGTCTRTMTCYVGTLGRAPAPVILKADGSSEDRGDSALF
jgi:hypothetical protein